VICKKMIVVDHVKYMHEAISKLNKADLDSERNIIDLF
jgi:hypothetical protein